MVITDQMAKIASGETPREERRKEITVVSMVIQWSCLPDVDKF